MNESPRLLAAVDMGSNSFRLMIGRVDETMTASGPASQIFQVDALREPVRLAAGLTPDKYLDQPARRRGVDALRRFGDRLRDFAPGQVRAVATNTLRVAKNAPEFLIEAEAALGFPIEVIAGREEARLIYLGASHDAPACQGNRLVVDIGGGSTEFIIGSGFQPKLMESLYIGCVSHSRQFFPSGNVDDYAMKQAELAARREIQVLVRQYRGAGWQQAVGSSGTARALAELIELNGMNDNPGEHGITREGLERLKRALVKAENANRVKLAGLKPDRIPVLPGGLAIMLGVFAELDIERMDVTDGALRLGVLYDLLGRSHHEDMRTVTVDQFMRRYAVDRAQAQRVRNAALSLLAQFPEPPDELREDNLALLGWAASLHEIGMSISHSGYHKHSAYIATHADMPGFSKTDQARLAALLLGHAGKLGKLSGSGRFLDWRMLFSLRLAFVLCRRRTDSPLPQIRVRQRADALDEGFEVRLPRDWIDGNPLIEYSLAQEADEWERVGKRYKVVYA
ncbi:exopolyphosphatase [Cupriavidus sp. USMAA2-4]|uniref:Exopolyphosphatase n=1 Tax=Cupriavidus malaysiensis TaxID=367825 RepID=A0A1D9I4L5_9BURK|nr:MULTISPECIES: exopolyphosphatase [Cupriavidus]AOY93469.1 exopolyphosphatase [Cupriavidus sp. USMAA2-4]AOZ00254.1 exopolyphosphatase [Cupriavidus sp. USMAHM13]AOZ06998.1 exopolyphosphatase [Cupriavidus malaysiensis]